MRYADFISNKRRIRVRIDTHGMSLIALVHRSSEAIVDGLCDSSEIPRVDFDRLVEESGNTSKLGDHQRSLCFSLTDDVLHAVKTMLGE